MRKFDERFQNAQDRRSGVVRDWLEENCESGAGFEVKASAAYAAYWDWLIAKGGDSLRYGGMTIFKFSRELNHLGVGRRYSNGAIYTGVRLRKASAAEAATDGP